MCHVLAWKLRPDWFWSRNQELELRCGKSEIIHFCVILFITTPYNHSAIASPLKLSLWEKGKPLFFKIKIVLISIWSEVRGLNHILLNQFSQLGVLCFKGDSHEQFFIVLTKHLFLYVWSLYLGGLWVQNGVDQNHLEMLFSNNI